MLVRMCLLENIRICSFRIDNNLVVFTRILYNHAHPLSTAERNYLHQLINHLLLLESQLNEILSLLYETITNCLCEVYEADFIRTRTLKLVFYLVLYYIVANDKTEPELVKVWLSSQSIKVILQVLSFDYNILNGHFLKDHFVSSEGSSFISKNTIDNP